jgi:hypothetical protein
MIWHSSKIFLIKKYTLSIALDLALDQEVFAECPLTSTPQRMALGFLETFAECPPV